MTPYQIDRLAFAYKFWTTYSGQLWALWKQIVKTEGLKPEIWTQFVENEQIWKLIKRYFREHWHKDICDWPQSRTQDLSATVLDGGVSYTFTPVRYGDADQFYIEQQFSQMIMIIAFAYFSKLTFSVGVKDLQGKPVVFALNIEILHRLVCRI